MKKRLCLLLGFLLFACNSEDAIDCFKTAGNIIQKEVVVTSFNEIFVNRDVELIIKEGPVYEVIIETGENLINDIEVVIDGSQLKVTDNNSCNLVRDYVSTKVYVSTPTLTRVRNSSQYTVSSDGVLSYPKLSLISEDFNAPDSYAVGDFNLEVQSQELSINSNDISSFYLKGQTETLIIGFYAGDGRFEGKDLIAQHVHIFHRGSNDMYVNPQQSLIGELRGTGNVIAVNEPPIVEVEQFYSGEVIFQ